MAKKQPKKSTGSQPASQINSNDILAALVTTNNRLMNVLERVVLGPQKADLVRAVDQTIAHYAFGEIENGGVGSDPSAEGNLAPSWESDPEMVGEDDDDGAGMRGLRITDISGNGDVDEQEAS